MNCPACDTAVVANARFCHACGARLAPAITPQPLAGAPETDRLPSWLKQGLEPSSASKSNAGGQSTQSPWPRPIPDGGLSHSMPAWLSPDTADQDGAPPVKNAPPATVQTEAQGSPSDDRPATIDVATFLSADDLPAWIRRIADPAAAEKPVDPKSAPGPERHAQPQPPPLARIGTGASRPAVSPPDRPAAKPAAASHSPIERAPTIPRQAVGTGSPAVSERSPRISWHLLLFVAILAAVAAAGYAIYLASFT